MQEHAWDELLRQIPASFHEGVTISTASGTEIILHSLIKVEEKYIILRGRPAGSTEGARLMILPYERINYISLPDRMTPKHVSAIFGQQNVHFADLPESLREQSDEAIDDEADEAEIEHDSTTAGGDSSAGGAGKSGGRPQPPSKSLLLAKLRARLASDSSSNSKK